MSKEVESLDRQTDRQTDRQSSIDFLKGICICFVIISHYSWSDIQRKTLLFPFWVDMAVPFFMVISGYVFSKSFQRAKVTHLRDGYRLKVTSKRIIRFTLPYLIVFILEYTIVFLSNTQVVSLSVLIKSFVTGGIGPGSYYYPVLIQFVFLFPIIFFIIWRFDYFGLIGCVAINLAYEVIKTGLLIDESLYRLLILRYITVIAFGCYFAIGKIKLHLAIRIAITVIGIGFIILYKYMMLQPMIMIYWTGTSMFACMYVIPFSEVIIQSDKIHLKFIELLGKASYNIYLVQMIYYGVVSSYLYRIIENRVLQFITSFLICILFGVAFYNIEEPITKRICRIMKI